MPELIWKGKDKVVNHHQEVPFRVLERRYAYGAEESGNRIIKGDNLAALKALLPQYEGKIKCVYIDPPYNTGNEGWVYNDNVNDPKIKKWLGEVVGKEGEDLSRHDKWLCMMYPRLKLLHKLLAEDGVIFVSINDIEVSCLRMLMDEIFGRSKFISQLVWKSRQNKDNRNITNVSIDHEYVLCYGEKLRGCKRDMEQYSNPDNDSRGIWTSANMVGLATEKERPNLHYDLINPKTGINYGKPAKGWRYDRNTMQELINEGRILWPSSPNGRPRKKQFLKDLFAPFTGYSSVIGADMHTRDGTKEQEDIFGNVQFAFPKYSRFVAELIEQATDSDSIVLDSFAGSGTTAHAVLNLNKADGGNRKFILIEMMDYAETIAAERVRRVISGYGDVAGTGGDFAYYELGEPLMYADGTLNENMDVARIRAYVWYMETRLSAPDRLENVVENTAENPYFLGKTDSAAYYFYYEKERATTLDEAFLAALNLRADAYIIYADQCACSERDLKARNITFKKIPRDITKL
jgi:adenine-specific DNA-methyltransferase